MESVTIEQTLIHEVDCLLNTDESSPPESKRVRLDNACNTNLNNSCSQSNPKWLYSGNTSLVEPEILEDMGVGMLEDAVTISENIAKHLQSQDCATLLINPDNNGKLQNEIYENSGIECNEEIHTSSSSDNANTDRIGQDSYMYDLTVLSSTENKPGYSSRMEENSIKNSMSVSAEKTDLNQFCLYRRKRKPSIIGEDKFNKLSDEIILMILKWLPKKCLVRSMLVCKRWCQIARDEVLWTRLDLGGKFLTEGTLGYILPRGVQILRLAQAEIVDPVFCEDSAVFHELYTSKLQYLDLSMAVISPNSLAILLSKCKYLKKLSLEKCVINSACCKAVSQNTELEVLNLSMCEIMCEDIEYISDLMKLKHLTALNMAWCGLDSECMTLLCEKMPPSIRRLNLAGCRKTMTDNNVKDLSRKCPEIIELDLSDCAMLTINTVHSLLNFSKLEHLSLSRCYSIPQPAYTRLAHMPCLLYLDIFGLMSEPSLKSLRENCREPEINKFLYSSVARPTVGIRRTSIWGLRVRD